MATLERAIQIAALAQRGKDRTRPAALHDRSAERLRRYMAAGQRLLASGA